MKRNRILCSLLSIGAIGAFFGHGMWAIDGKESFVKLFAGSFDHVLGYLRQKHGAKYDGITGDEVNEYEAAGGATVVPVVGMRSCASSDRRAAGRHTRARRRRDRRD